MKLIIIDLLIAYIALLLLARFASDIMIFLPPKSSYQDAPGFIKLSTADGNKIFAYYLPNQHAKYTLLVSHGNAEDIGNMLPFLLEMHAHGFSVFSYDYHGYGLSGGKPSEKNTYMDIDAAYNYLINELHQAPETIIVYGHSLGAAVTLDLAIRKPVAGVILQSGFTTVFRVMTRLALIPFDKFNNLNKVKLLKVPLLVIHGTLDVVISFWHGQKLYESAPSPKEFYIVQNAGHNDLIAIAGDGYWSALAGFVQRNITKK